jgi:Putative stress-induced transcription regulator
MGMTTIDEEQSKAAPGPLAVVQALVNTQYGQGRRAHVELTSSEQLRSWLVARQLLTDGTPVAAGEFRRVLQLREALRSLLRTNNDRETPASQVEVLNRLASNDPRTGYCRRGWSNCPPGRDRVHRHDGRHLGQAQNLSQ